MLSRCRASLVSIIFPSLVIASSTAQAVCDANQAPRSSASHFVITDETVYDQTTRLTWMRCSYGQTWHKGGGCDGDVKPMNWDAAMALRVPGDNGWRLPSKDELDTIVEWHCKKPAIDEEVFPGTALIAYWSSTPSGPSYAWHINFRWGISAWQYLRSNQYAVRFVRDDR